MKEYIFVLEDRGTPFPHYDIIKADNEKEAVIKFIEHWGGIDIFTPERLNELIDSFNTFELIKLYESKHRRVIQFGEFNAIYGIPSK